MRKERAICIAIAAATLLVGLGAMWWWALFGMSERVATAWTWTVAVGTFGIGMLAANPSWDK